MGIQVEYNPDLALRAFGTPIREIGECLPEKLKEGETYAFLKEGQRNFWLGGEIPLLETKGNQRLSRPVASITILNATHFLKDEKLYTPGLYKVNEAYDLESKEIHFEGYSKIKKEGEKKNDNLI